MRRFLNGFRNLQSLNRGVAVRGVLSAAAVAGVLALSPAFAKEPADKAAASETAAHAESAHMPECLAKLKLSDEQQEKVRDIVQNYDGSITKVWKQFSDRYMQTIAMESSLLAAIEDGLTEPQRQKAREQRRKTAQLEKAMAATSTKVNQAKDKDQEESAKPANDSEEAIDNLGITLTDEQEATADKVQEKYHSQLRSLNRDIQGLHTRLVSLEADKLVEIEKVLTKEQLTQLRKHRQEAPMSSKVAVSKREANTKE